MNRFSWFQEHATLLRKILGATIMLSVLFIAFPDALSETVNKISNSKNKLFSAINTTTTYPAPPIEGIEAWINSRPLTRADWKNKVVLVDFWTYTCSNCISTLPYLNEWYAKYRGHGFLIIGVHSPKFPNQTLENVKKNVERYGIKYPVALDNKFVTWENYKTQYWPSFYLVDRNGNVVYTSVGAEDYETTEYVIQYLLGLKESR